MTSISLKALAAAAAITVLPFSAFAATVSIDDFNTAQTVITNAAPAFDATSTVADASAFGGNRTLSIISTGVFPFAKTATVGSGVVNIGSSYGASVFTGSLQYTGSATDLTDGGVNDVFRIGVVGSDAAGTYTVSLNGVSQSLTFGPGAGFVDFALSGFGGAETSVTDILVEVTGSTNTADYSFDFIVATDSNPPVIPLPAAGWLMVAGAGALAATRRKKIVA